MGIFNLFKKQNKDLNFPENELEKSLIDAYNDVAARNKFYTKLLWNDLIVLTNDKQDLNKGFNTLKEATAVEFVMFEDGKIPVFTSENRVFDKGIIKEQIPILTMNGQVLFETAKGATFILNPYSDYGKELIKEEIESLLDGTIFNENNLISIKEDTEVILGQPQNYPTEFLKSLSQLFEQHETVKSAYVGMIKMEKSEELPHLIIAIDIEAELSSISSKAIPIAEKMLAKGEIVDFIKIEDNGGVSEYFIQETKPFYKRN